MPGRGYERHHVVFNSANSSTYTSNPVLTADAATLSLSWTTVSGTASRLTVQGSNDQGFTGAITNWSTITALTAQGFYTVDPGARWMRIQRHSEESQATTQLQTWNT